MKRFLACAAAIFLSTSMAVAQPPAKGKTAQSQTAASALSWTVDRAQSSIGFSSSVGGQAFRGSFSRWSATIAFDPKALPASSVRVTIDPASVASGDTSRDATLKQANWFDTSRFPQAVFESSDFRALGANRYEARGTLEIKGKKTPLTLPFTLVITGAAADMQGAVTLDRRALGLGADMADATVPAAVAVTVRVKASRAP